jgi:hypothetical protein
MTEAEWLAEGDVERLLHEVWERQPGMEWEDRKPTLLMCACLGPAARFLPAEYGKFMELLKRSADEPGLEEELRSAEERLVAVSNSHGEFSTLVFAIGYGDLGLAGFEVAGLLGAVSLRAGGEEKAHEAAASELRRQAECVREIYGNPFRPVRMEEGWATAEVMRIANKIYNAEAFLRMGELAAALERAGCGDENMLGHLRKASRHVRGCWVIDLVLGKDWMGGPR